MAVKFRLKELMARKELELGDKVTYSLVSSETGIAISTLSNLANNRQKMVGLSVLDRLCAFFNCPIEDLMIYMPDGNKKGYGDNGNGGGVSN